MRNISWKFWVPLTVFLLSLSAVWSLLLLEIVLFLHTSVLVYLILFAALALSASYASLVHLKFENLLTLLFHFSICSTVLFTSNCCIWVIQNSFWDCPFHISLLIFFALDLKSNLCRILYLCVYYLMVCCLFYPCWRAYNLIIVIGP